MFTKKSRIKAQEQLLQVARRALDALDVKPHRDHDGVIEPMWNPKVLPLEYRRIVSLHLETLVFYVYEPDASGSYGDWSSIAELQDAIAFIQIALTDRASISEQTVRRRQALRAHAAADTLERVEAVVTELEEWRAGKNPLGAWSAFQHEQLLMDAKEAVRWFHSQDEIDRANAVRSTFDKKQYPQLSLARLDDAVRRLEAFQPTRDDLPRS
jgi:hypothetical protein